METGQDEVTGEAARSAPAHLFFFGPFRITSELDIPELRGVEGSGRIEVSIRIREVPIALEQPRFVDPACEITPDAYLLKIPGVARYLVLKGNHVYVDPEPDVALSDVCIYLLGSVFGALCHQNGLLPLHASAVEAGGGVTAFLGDSGAGKSTLAAFLARRGYRIISDDICLLEESGGGAMQVVPVAGWLKLWRESFDQLGEQPEEENRVFSEDDKFRMFLQSSKFESRQLNRLVFLVRSEDPDAEPQLRALGIAEALALTMRMTYVAYIPEALGEEGLLFHRCARAIGSAKAYELTGPWGWEKMPAVLDLLEEQVLAG